MKTLTGTRYFVTFGASVYSLGFAYFLFLPKAYTRDLLINFLPQIALLHIPFIILCILCVFLFNKKKKTYWNGFIALVLFSFTIQLFSLNISQLPTNKGYASFLEEKKNSQNQQLSEDLTVLSLNVLHENTNTKKFFKMLNTHNIDIVGLVEVNKFWHNNILNYKKNYPHIVSYPYQNSFKGISLMSKYPILKHKLLFFEDDLPYLKAKIQLPNTIVEVYVVHPYAPINYKRYLSRNSSLKELSSIVTYQEPTLVFGDFNLTPWSTYYKEFLENSQLEDSRSPDKFFLSTWERSGFSLAIDHIFHSKHFIRTDLKTLENIGSDHLPLIARFKSSN